MDKQINTNYKVAVVDGNYYGNGSAKITILDTVYDNAKDARIAVADMVSDNTIQSRDYYAITERDADYIASGRDEDMSNYDWDDAECDCGSCDTCAAMMIAQDVDYIISNSL